VSEGRLARFSREDEKLMRLALALARRGRATVRPNPQVGAVIVKGGRILARGFHQRAGEPHAEIRALADLARRAGSVAPARGATMYVTLEPCCHQGRTGPCTTALRQAGIARVVVGCRDLDPRVDGRGSQVLRRAGVRVDEGCLEEDCLALNRAFFTWIREGRPLVTLKLAATADGFLADGRRRGARAPAWITGPAARARVHAMRADHDAVLVGAGTVEADDPQLTVRLPQAREGTKGDAPEAGAPLRVIVDGRFRVPAAARVFREGPAPLVIVSREALMSPAGKRKAAQLRAKAEVIAVPGRGVRLRWASVLAALGTREIQSVLVEGGAQVAGGLIAEGLVDRVALFHGPFLMGAGVPMASGAGRPLGEALALKDVALTRLGPDWLVTADVEMKAGEGGRRGARKRRDGGPGPGTRGPSGGISAPRKKRLPRR